MTTGDIPSIANVAQSFPAEYPSAIELPIIPICSTVISDSNATVAKLLKLLRPK